jgi:hypothetical protein
MMVLFCPARMRQQTSGSCGKMSFQPMHLFDQLIIREAEVFTCRVVSYVLQRSPELRDALISVVNSKVPERWLLNRSHFSCSLEYPTEDSGSGDGRIDLLVEIDNAVLALEAKLVASLSPTQPSKYMQTLKTVAKKLSDLRHLEVADIVVLLIPKGRQAEAQAVLAKSALPSDSPKCVITWEELFEAWRSARAVDDVARFVLDELEHFVSAQTGRWKDFSRLLPLLRSPLAQATHDAHYEFLAWLYPAFRSNRPYLNSRLMAPRRRADRTYIGYYFALGQVDGCWGWFGFVDPRFAGEADAKEPVLVMGADFDIDCLDENVFSPVTFTHPGFHKDAQWWRIRFDRTWDDLTRWQQALLPVRTSVEGAYSERS